MWAAFHQTQGHFEFFLCDTQDLEDPDGVVTQECLNTYPLTRVAKSNEGPVDPAYPGRYFPDPPCRADTGEIEQVSYQNPASRFAGEPNGRATYRFPDIECEHCVLQMVWRESNRFDVFCLASFPLYLMVNVIQISVRFWSMVTCNRASSFLRLVSSV